MNSNKWLITEVIKIFILFIPALALGFFLNWGVGFSFGGLCVLGLILVRAIKKKHITLSSFISGFLGLIGGCIWFVTGLSMAFSDQKHLNDFMIYIFLGNIIINFSVFFSEKPKKGKESSNQKKG